MICYCLLKCIWILFRTVTTRPIRGACVFSETEAVVLLRLKEVCLCINWRPAKTSYLHNLTDCTFLVLQHLV